MHSSKITLVMASLSKETLLDFLIYLSANFCILTGQLLLHSKAS